MRYFAALLLVPLAFGAGKGDPKGSASNKFVSIEATAYLDKAAVNRALGQDLDDGIVLIEVKMTPLSGQTIDIDRDDFLLRSDRDGQTANPYSPSQLAGSSVLVVGSRSGTGGGGVMADERGPVWGGMGGGRPSRLPTGQQSPVMGNAAVQAEASATVMGGSGKETPLLQTLENKILPEKEVTEPVTGQLYFLMEGKHKTKHIELLYKTPAGRLSIRFAE